MNNGNKLKWTIGNHGNWKKFWGPFWSYQLNSSANSAYWPRKWAKWAELAVLFSWQLQKSPHDFDFSIANYSSELFSNFHWVPQFSSIIDQSLTWWSLLQGSFESSRGWPNFEIIGRSQRQSKDQRSERFEHSILEGSSRRCVMHGRMKLFVVRFGNCLIEKALTRLQWVHEPVDLWNITFCTLRFWDFKSSLL